MMKNQDRDVFSGRQAEELEPEQTVALLASFPERVRLVVLNTCLSLDLAHHITENHAADMAIGVEGRINDDRAILFATTFYAQLAEGLSVRRAFDLACVHFVPGGHGRAHAPLAAVCRANVPSMSGERVTDWFTESPPVPSLPAP